MSNAVYLNATSSFAMGFIPHIFMPRVKVIPKTLKDSESKHRLDPNRFGYGLILCGLYVLFATIVVLTTYVLTSIANRPIFIGVNTQQFTHNEFNVPVTALLQGNDSFFTLNSSTCDATLSLSDLLYERCFDHNCAMSFLSQATKTWRLVGQAFSLIKDFDQPIFQRTNETIHLEHINNLNGWNKATAQFYIKDYNMAITCMVRRANYSVNHQNDESYSVIDSIAFCSERPYDPNWICENVVDVNANTYAIQISKGEVTYVGVTKRKEIYMNAGAVANFTQGKFGSVSLQTVNAINEYQQGILQAIALFDVVPFSDCSKFNFQTKLGWLLQLQGSTTMIWQCDSLMDTNSLVLWCMTLYQAALQIVFLPRSVICTIPVQASKNIVGLAILFVAFWGNENLQTLSTYIYQNPSYGLTYYGLCGPAQLASIVGIMTGDLIQMWFNPRIVTQTWILLLFSVVNWILVFSLEYFVFPKKSINIVSKCALPTSSNCFTFESVRANWYVSAIASGVVIFIAILTVYLHSRYASTKVMLPPTNSVLQYLKISDISLLATSPNGCVYIDEKGDTRVDPGVLLIKNMLQITSSTMTRSTNAMYCLIYQLLPFRRAKQLYSDVVGTILTIHLQNGVITKSSSYRGIRDIMNTGR